jgi:hypothetical protein
MAVAPYTESEVDAFRERGDAFTRDMLQEYYDHFAGFKETLDIEQIYEEYGDLTSLETAQRLERAPTELWRFACEGFLGNLTRSHQAKAAEVEATLELTVDGETVPYRMARVVMSNETDRGKRQRIDEQRIRLLDEHLNPLYLDAHRIDRGAIRELNAPNYYELYKRFGFRLDELAVECRALLDETERLWEDEGDKLFRARLGFGLDEAKPWDVGRLFRAAELDAHYPADKMLPALEATLAELGVDIRSQANVHLDLEVRPSKSPRAFCAPIEVPGKVMLVIQPIGGKDDWEALFHEAGHTEHYATTSDSLSMEGKRLGDNAVTEGWAMLMQHLVTEPTWLSRRLDVPDVDALGKDGAVSLLYFVRRYSAKLLYEIELFQVDDPTTMRSRYAELLSDALKIPIHSENYLDDVDGSFYVIGYLRSWAFEAQLRDFLRGEFGNEWFARREAGGLLRELWSVGQEPTADALLKDVTGATLEMASVGDRIRERL